MKILTSIIILIFAAEEHSQNNFKSLEIVRRNSFLSYVYPVKIIINDTLIKIKNNETMVVNYMELKTLYKSGFFCRRKQLFIKEGELLKIKHSFFFPFIFDNVKVISKDKFNSISKKTKRKREVTLKYSS
jgi:hypothetical protein